MPFSLVFTKEGGSDAVTAVPSGWIKTAEGTDILYWPRTAKKKDVETLRTNGNSVYDVKWRKQKCRVKMRAIETFFEATKLEEMYAGFQDTEDEEAYFKKQREYREHPTHKYVESIDLNSEFEQIMATTIDESISQIEKDDTTILEKGFESNTLKNYTTIMDESISQIEKDNTTTSEKGLESTLQNFITINEEQLLQLIKDNNLLSDENKLLKEEIKLLNDHIIDTDKKHESIQIKLDKILEIVQLTGTRGKNEVNECTDDEPIIVPNLNFPVESKEELDLLEEKLIDKQLENSLVKKFSKIVGSNGHQKCSKIALLVIKHIIKDELLQQCSWKGIKGCSKIPFVQYFNIRQFLYKVLKLADHSCTILEVDTALQLSAIKHSKQRLKRNSEKMENNKVRISEKKKKASRNISQKESETSDISSVNISQNNLEEEDDKSDDENGTRTLNLDKPNTSITLSGDMVSVHRGNDD